MTYSIKVHDDLKKDLEKLSQSIRQSFPVGLRTPNHLTLQAMQSKPEQEKYASSDARFDNLSHVDGGGKTDGS